MKLADEIYRSVDREVEDETIPPEILAEMERRDAEYEANPASGSTLEQVENELFKRSTSRLDRVSA